jgi:hypothetical protein
VISTVWLLISTRSHAFHTYWIDRIKTIEGSALFKNRAYLKTMTSIGDFFDEMGKDQFYKRISVENLSYVVPISFMVAFIVLLSFDVSVAKNPLIAYLTFPTLFLILLGLTGWGLWNSKDRPTKVHVDAKITNRDNPEKPKRTFVAYSNEDGSEIGFEEIHHEDADQADAAELYAIDFALKGLKRKGRTYTLLCDHESVVQQLQHQELKAPAKLRPILVEVWNELQGSTKFKIEHFPVNLADKLLNQKWLEIEKSEEDKEGQREN